MCDILIHTSEEVSFMLNAFNCDDNVIWLKLGLSCSTCKINI